LKQKGVKRHLVRSGRDKVRQVVERLTVRGRAAIRSQTRALCYGPYGRDVRSGNETQKIESFRRGCIAHVRLKEGCTISRLSRPTPTPHTAELSRARAACGPASDVACLCSLPTGLPSVRPFATSDGSSRRGPLRQCNANSTVFDAILVRITVFS
jgi:hypothetical protein